MPKIRPVCEVDDCEKFVKSNKMCAMHWKRQYKYGDVNTVHPRGGHNKLADFCSVEGCDKAYQASGFCQMHYRRWDLYGDPLHIRITGNKKPAKYKNVLAPKGHPNAKADGTIFEHRLVMSQMIGRALAPGENVHHINGDTFDNRPENLELWNTAQPAGQRPSDKVEYAIMILNLYAPELLADNGELS